MAEEEVQLFCLECCNPVYKKIRFQILKKYQNQKCGQDPHSLSRQVDRGAQDGIAFLKGAALELV